MDSKVSEMADELARLLPGLEAKARAVLRAYESIEDDLIAEQVWDVARACELLLAEREVITARPLAALRAAGYEVAEGVVPPQVEVQRTGVRPVVAAFALAMEERLRANDHKGGWEQDSAISLLGRIFEETIELKRAVAGEGGDKREWATRIRREAADVANFAMMIADNDGALMAAHPPVEQAVAGAVPTVTITLDAALAAEMGLFRWLHERGFEVAARAGIQVCNAAKEPSNV